MQKHWASSQNRQRFRWFLKIKNLSSTVLPSFFSGPLCLSPSPSAMFPLQLNSSARKIDCIIIHPPQRILCLVGAQIQSKYVKMELTNLKLSCHQPNGSLCSTPKQFTSNYNVKGRLTFSMTLDTAVEFVSVEEVPCQFREGNVATRRMLSWSSRKRLGMPTTHHLSALLYTQFATSWKSFPNIPKAQSLLDCMQRKGESKNKSCDKPCKVQGLASGKTNHAEIRRVYNNIL